MCLCVCVLQDWMCACACEGLRLPRAASTVTSDDVLGSAIVGRWCEALENRVVERWCETLAGLPCCWLDAGRSGGLPVRLGRLGTEAPTMPYLRIARWGGGGQ